MNPYWGLDFFLFLLMFLRRMGALIGGQLTFSELASDELQILVLLCIGISSALIGTFLVLKRMTMLANALSHTILLGIILSYFCVQWFFGGGPLIFNNRLFLMAAILTALITTALTDLCKRILKLQEEASIGLIFTFLFALGVMVVTLYSRNMHLGAEVIMGNIDALHLNDLKLALSLAIANIMLIILLFKYYQILAFDEVLAKSLGCVPLLFQYLLMTQTSLMAIGAFRAVGVFLFLIFLTAPVLSARLFTKKLTHLMGYAALLNATTIVLGVALSRHILTVYGVALSTAGLTCVCSALVYPLSLLGVKIYILILKSLQKRNASLHNLRSCK